VYQKNESLLPLLLRVWPVSVRYYLLVYHHEKSESPLWEENAWGYKKVKEKDKAY